MFVTFKWSSDTLLYHVKYTVTLALGISACLIERHLLNIGGKAIVALLKIQILAIRTKCREDLKRQLALVYC